MQQCTLGSTGLAVSRLTIGAWQLGGPLVLDGRQDGHPDPGRDNVLRLIRTLHDRGINAIDTAEQYGAGESELRVGEAIAADRASWIVSTKFGARVGPNGERINDAGPATLMTSLEGSLRRLRSDTIDIFLYHCPPDPAQLAEAAEVFQRAKAAGKVRFLGISTDDLEQAATVARHGLLDVLQCSASLIEPHRELIDLASRHGAGTQVRGVLAAGRLSGKYLDAPPAWAADDIRGTWNQQGEYPRFAKLRELVPAGLTMAQASLRWALDQPGHHTLCLGAKSLEDYESAIAAVDCPPLDAGVSAALEAAAKSLNSPS